LIIKATLEKEPTLEPPAERNLNSIVIEAIRPVWKRIYNRILSKGRTRRDTHQRGDGLTGEGVGRTREDRITTRDTFIE
jgi:hypothetical protein